jgi:hypothetical protein
MGYVFSPSGPVWQEDQPQNTQGLDPSYMSSRTIGGSPGKMAGWMDSGYAGTPGVQQNTYNGPGGTWTQGNNGGWTSGTGQVVNNLSGYLGMKNQQAQGSDFGGYQSQLQGLLSDPSKIQQTPGYQFAVDQGNQAINRSAAAKGMLNSGGVLAELAKYGQGMASQQYDTQTNRLADLMHGAQTFGVQSGYFPGQPQQKAPAVMAGQSYVPGW